MGITPKVIERLSVYRRVLAEIWQDGARNLFSHQLAELTGVTAAQIRRDLMTIGFSGSPSRGYEVAGLRAKIAEFLDDPAGQAVALIGVGHLGQAVIAFFNGRRRNLQIVAGFDVNPAKVDRVILGCRCYAMDALPEVLERDGIKVAILAVPGDQAQRVALQLVRHGVRGILNFAPERLRVPEYVSVENVDITVALERIAFFARQDAMQKEAVR